MGDAMRSEFLSRINGAYQELKAAGPIHRRDLIKRIKRMERELRDYDRFHREARR